jgi:hypothetical protein
MNKDKIALIVSLTASIVSVTATLYKSPMVAVLIFSLAVLVYSGYVLYITKKGVPGNVFIRFSPILILIIVAGLLVYFWPATLKVCLYYDTNANGLRDDQEKGIHRELIEVLDINHVSRNLTSNADGECYIGPISRGPYRVKAHGVHISGIITRGKNMLSLGIPPTEDITPPEVRIFLGDEVFINAENTPSKEIYAHIWYNDDESSIETVEIDWGDGWRTVDLNEPYMNFYLLSHKYNKTGLKRVRVRVTNNQGLSSIPKDKPMRLREDYATIKLD